MTQSTPVNKKASRNNGLFYRESGKYPTMLLVNLAALLVIGIIMLFSASYTSGYLRHDDSFFFVKTQLRWMVIGLAAMGTLSCVNYRRLKGWITVLAYLVTTAMLVMVYFCEPIYNCHRWLWWRSGPLSAFPTLQVSEVAKLVIILAVAAVLEKYGDKRVIPLHLEKTRVWHGPRFWRRLRKGLWNWHWERQQKKIRKDPNYLKRINRRNRTQNRWLMGVMLPLAITGVYVGLIAPERHISGALLIAIIVCGMLFLSGSGGWTFFTTMIGGAAAAAWGATMLYQYSPTFHSRMEAFLSGIQSDQTQNSIYAIGSGGLFGLGFSNSIQKQLYLSECYNDFIFSVICEELGLIGAAVIIMLFLAFVWQILMVAMNSRDKYGTYIGFGVAVQFACQVFLNIAVVTDTGPNTGISLPFFSSGGTSLFLLLVEMGIVLSIARDGDMAARERQQQEEQRQQAERRAKQAEKARARAAENRARMAKEPFFDI